MSQNESVNQTFWEHLDELRGTLIKSASVTTLFSIVAFIFKDELFAIVLAPGYSDFITYRLLYYISSMFDANESADFSVQLINTGLAEQFIIHMKTALCAGLLCASPYIIYQLLRFISPALYSNERKCTIYGVGSGYLMFIIGILVSYYIIFPLTFRFLGTYQVSGDVTNMITLESYMSTLIIMSLSMGVIFEMPVLAWIFAKLGVINAEFMRKYRKHAIVIILIIAAIITPTSDIFTLLVVSMPMCLLYEASIMIAANTKKAL